jgi:general secretion pathway protein G
MHVHRLRPTVVELIALVLALAIVLTFVVPERFRLAGRPAEDARSDMNAIGSGLETYRLDTGHYPAAAQGLAALVSRPASHPFNWRGPYLLPRVPHDPWGMPYGYSRADDRTGESFVLWSYGADRRPGGTGAGADVVFRP